MFDDFIQASAAQYGVPVPWIQAVITVESNWDSNAYNPNDPGGARGLMQIIAPTAHAYGITDLSELFDPATNIDVGSHLLGDLRARYGDDFQSVYSAYNSGNPSLWQTSSQVAANVQRAMDALAQWATDNPGEAVAGSSAGLILVILGALYFMRKGKR